MMHSKTSCNKWFLLSFLCFCMGVYALIFQEHSNTHMVAPPFAHFDKFVHFMLFMLQFWLLGRAYGQSKQKIPFTFLGILALFYAVGSEVAQHFWTQTRQGDVWDVVADLLGAILGLSLAHLWLRTQKK